MILLALLTGGLVFMIWARQVSYVMLFALCSWGLLAASTPIGVKLVEGLNSISTALDGVFT
ncbi:hypothetical protein [Actinomadura geliboluensis]|uniref:hypothetical protein n=1 Tax=Actinomadura geliboluensis TaxID=882440 RepID=UPI00263995BA|nr:hypothetical protein [Actinomadura geliboluensis]